MTPLTGPALLRRDHDLSSFTSGVSTLDEWLRKRALKNAIFGATKTYVTCEHATMRVVGFYSLCAAQILRSEVPGNMSRNMPTEIPCALLGRLAVDAHFQRRGIARALLFHALNKTRLAAQQIGIRALYVHAINDQAALFYESFGFKRLPVETPTYAIDLLDFNDVPLAAT